jgi:ArsR family transcriptional regulator
MENDHDFAAMFKALGDPTRLHIFDFLRRCCCPVALDDAGAARPVEGPTVGDVCCHVAGAEKINSTISHHLKELRLVGLITVERRGKNMICGVNRDALSALTRHLANEANGSCCEPDCCEPECC